MSIATELLYSKSSETLGTEENDDEDEADVHWRMQVDTTLLMLHRCRIVTNIIILSQRVGPRSEEVPPQNQKYKRPALLLTVLAHASNLTIYILIYTENKE